MHFHHIFWQKPIFLAKYRSEEFGSFERTLNVLQLCYHKLFWFEADFMLKSTKMCPQHRHFHHIFWQNPIFLAKYRSEEVNFWLTWKNSQCSITLLSYIFLIEGWFHAQIDQNVSAAHEFQKKNPFTKKFLHFSLRTRATLIQRRNGQGQLFWIHGFWFLILVRFVFSVRYAPFKIWNLGFAHLKIGDLRCEL